MSRRRGRRDIEQSSLSFLDCICCGFGAIILLLVLTKLGEPLAIEEARIDLDRRLVELEAALNQTGGNIKEAAHVLGVDRSTLYAKISKYGIER